MRIGHIIQWILIGAFVVCVSTVAQRVQAATGAPDTTPAARQARPVYVDNSRIRRVNYGRASQVIVDRIRGRR